MGRQNKGILILFAAIAALFLFELGQLLMLRFEQGDVYPPYSSFRSDPLGVRALYGALDSLEGVSVTRNLRPFTGLGEGRGKTLLICGDYPREKEFPDVVEALEGFAMTGGRLVITYYPTLRAPVVTSPEFEEKEEKEEQQSPEEKHDEEADDQKDEEKEGDEKEGEEEKEWHIKLVSLEERWDFSFDHFPLVERESAENRSDRDEAPSVQAQKQRGPEELPPSLSWHTTTFFHNLNEAWRTLYSWDGRPVIIERDWGEGTIVLCSDSFFLSNEAMREERHPQLLAWLVGPSSTAVFDEFHLGVRENPGVMALIRKYRLDGVVCVLLLIAGLFVWRNAFSLTPKRDVVSSQSTLSKGKDSAAGLVNLLRRSISPRKVLAVCVQEWQRARALDSKQRGKKASVQAVVDRHAALPPGQRDLVKAYRDICAVVNERESKGEI